MAIINCPDCGKSVSDKAVQCPHCGHNLPKQSAIESVESVNELAEVHNPKKTKSKLIIVLSLTCLTILVAGAYFMFDKPSSALKSGNILEIPSKYWLDNDTIFANKIKAAHIDVDTTGILVFEEKNPEAFVKFVEALNNMLSRRNKSMQWAVRNIFNESLTEFQIKRLTELNCLVDSNYIETWSVLKDALNQFPEKSTVSTWVNDGQNFFDFQFSDYPIICGIMFDGTGKHYYITKDYKIVSEDTKQKLISEYEQAFEETKKYDLSDDKTSELESEEDDFEKEEEEEEAEELLTYNPVATEDEHIYNLGEVEQKPEFIGGDGALMKWLNQNLHYPDKAAQNNVQGRVIISFTVEKSGCFSDIYVIRSADTELDNEAIRVIKKMPTWKSAKKNGKSVRCKYIIPISFKIKKN